MKHDDTPATAPTPADPGAGLPASLRARFGDRLAEAQHLAEAEAFRLRQPAGVAMDRVVRAVLDDASRTGANPSAATQAAYRRDYERLRTAGITPLDHASTRAHFDRLRSACRWTETVEIARLRSLAEAARKAKEPEAMREFTRQAFERAVVFRALYLDADRPTWADKAAALRAAGQRPISRSKRKAGRHAPTPDQLLVALARQPGRCSRVELYCCLLSVFGVRPAELVRGVVLDTTTTGLRLAVAGAKVDATRGQPMRVLEVDTTRRGQSALAVALLRAHVEESGGDLSATAADIVAVRRAMREVQEGLSPYAYRHARASDAKATQGREGVAAWLGHSTDRTQQGYGNARSGRGAVAVKTAKATRPVRQTKTMPPTAAERFAKIAARLASRIPAQAPKAAPTVRRVRKPRW